MPFSNKNSDNFNNRQKIIDAATNLVMERGVKGTSLADIARTAGISKGTLFYHFSAKDDLIYELTNQHFDELTRASLKRVAQMQDTSLSELLYDGLLTILQAEDRGKLNLYLLQEAVTENPLLQNRFAAKYQEFNQMMREYLDIVLPQIDPEKSKILSILLVSILDGLIIQWLLNPDAIPVKDIAALIADILEGI